MTIELYVFPPSPRAFKVMAVANHLGLDWTLKMIDFRKGDQKTPQYAALNPNMKMPTLKEGDYVLWESNAIGQYLALKRPELGLFPRDERARLDVTRWQFWDLAHWDPACAVFAFEDSRHRPVYWIYNYKRGTFYPFAPDAGSGEQRDNEREMVLKAQIGSELPVEQELERWFPLWGAPI